MLIWTSLTIVDLGQVVKHLGEYKLLSAVEGEIGRLVKSLRQWENT